jgi:hypothetical protein
MPHAYAAGNGGIAMQEERPAMQASAFAVSSYRLPYYHPLLKLLSMHFHVPCTGSVILL